MPTKSKSDIDRQDYKASKHRAWAIKSDIPHKNQSIQWRWKFRTTRPFFIRKKEKNNRKSKHCEALKAEEHEEEIHQYSQLICCLRHQNKEEGHNFIPRRFSYL